MKRATWVMLLCATTAAVPAGCADRKRITPDPGGIGDRCEDPEDCRSDLTCRDDLTCGPAGLTAEGQPCTYSDDCLEGLACLWERNSEGVPQTLCRAVGDGVDGDFCATTADCEAMLVCVPDGFGGLCRPATTYGDLGESCDSPADCHAGLVCASYGECVRGTSPDGGPGFPIWDGIECATGDTGAVARFHFEVPRGALGPGQDFFRLPWPNDIRKTAGHLDLSGFPHPAMPTVPVDVLDRFLRAAEQELTGFGTNGAIFFRSSRSIDWDTVVNNEDRQTIYFVDLTPPTDPAAPYGRWGFGWAASTGRGRYICPDWLAVRPPRGWVLMPDTTYAVVLTAGVKDADGNTMGRDPDFEQMLRPGRPGTDETLGRAWDAYAPFRAFLARESIDTGTILVAAVFTTQNFPDTLARAKTVVDASPAPVPTGLIRCTAGTHSLCDDELTGDEHVRGCFDESTEFHELQGAFPTPVFQEGSPPYRTPDDGGGFTIGADGNPEIQRDENVCFSLTVPRDVPMPADGWPVVVYTHGTGGNYRSFVTNGVAESLATVTLADGSEQHFAVLSFDQPEHGRRRGASTMEPELLFYNFMNPHAAYGNVLQGAIDGFQAARLLTTLDLDAATSPTGAEVRFDSTRMYYYGHSQGSTHGVLTVAFDPSFAAVVLSGAGGSLIDSLLNKASPYDVAGALRMALADPDIGDLHPALTIFQTYLEVADPVNYGKYVVSLPMTGNLPKHVLMTYGLRDTYSPKQTLAAMAGSLGLAIAEPVIDDIGGFGTVVLPASGNRNVAGQPTTAVLTQHNPPAGEDGHFVSTTDETAERRVVQFLGTAAAGTATASTPPTVVP